MSDDRDDIRNHAAATGDDWLERQLREDADVHRNAYVADDDFTARVMSTLPSPILLPAWRRPAIVALWTIALAGLASALPHAMLDVGREAYRLLATQPVSLSGIAGIAALIVASSWAAAAYSLGVSD